MELPATMPALNIAGRQVMVDDGHTHSFSGPVTAAIWCEFALDAHGWSVGAGCNVGPKLPGQRCLAVVYNQRSLYVCDVAGKVYEATLPFPVVSIFALASGLLLQRHCSLDGAGSSVVTVPAVLPAWFALFHPYEEPSAVSLQAVGDHGSVEDAHAYAKDRLISVVDVAHEPARGLGANTPTNAGPEPLAPSRLVASFDSGSSSLKLYYIAASRFHLDLTTAVHHHDVEHVSPSPAVGTTPAPVVRSGDEAAAVSMSTSNRHAQPSTVARDQSMDMTGVTRRSVRFSPDGSAGKADAKLRNNAHRASEPLLDVNGNVVPAGAATTDGASRTAAAAAALIPELTDSRFSRASSIPSGVSAVDPSSFSERAQQERYRALLHAEAADKTSHIRRRWSRSPRKAGGQTLAPGQAGFGSGRVFTSSYRSIASAASGGSAGSDHAELVAAGVTGIDHQAVGSGSGGMHSHQHQKFTGTANSVGSGGQATYAGAAASGGLDDSFNAPDSTMLVRRAAASSANSRAAAIIAGGDNDGDEFGSMDLDGPAGLNQAATVGSGSRSNARVKSKHRQSTGTLSTLSELSDVRMMSDDDVDLTHKRGSGNSNRGRRSASPIKELAQRSGSPHNANGFVGFGARSPQQHQQGYVTADWFPSLDDGPEAIDITDEALETVFENDPESLALRFELAAASSASSSSYADGFSGPYSNRSMLLVEIASLHLPSEPSSAHAVTTCNDSGVRGLAFVLCLADGSVVVTDVDFSKCDAAALHVLGYAHGDDEVFGAGMPQLLSPLRPLLSSDQQRTIGDVRAVSMPCLLHAAGTTAALAAAVACDLLAVTPSPDSMCTIHWLRCMREVQAWTVAAPAMAIEKVAFDHATSTFAVKLICVGDSGLEEPLDVEMSLPHFSFTDRAVRQALHQLEALAASRGSAASLSSSFNARGMDGIVLPEAVMAARSDIATVRDAIAATVAAASAQLITLSLPMQDGEHLSVRVNVQVRKTLGAGGTRDTVLIQRATGSITPSWSITLPASPPSNLIDEAAVRLLQTVSEHAARQFNAANAGSESNDVMASPPRPSASKKVLSTPQSTVRLMRSMKLNSPGKDVGAIHPAAPAAAAAAAATTTGAGAGPLMVVAVSSDPSVFLRVASLAGYQSSDQQSNQRSPDSSSASTFASLLTSAFRSLGSKASNPAEVAAAMLSAFERHQSGNSTVWAALTPQIRQALMVAAGLAFAASDPVSVPSPYRRPSTFTLVSRRDLAALDSFAHSSMSTSASPAVSARSLLRTAMRTLLLPQPGGVGLGVLTVHGMSGTPLSELAKAAAQAAAVINAVLGIGDVSNGAPPDQDDDGIDAVINVHSALRFGRDKRLRSIGSDLRACRPHYLRIVKPAEATDHDFMALQQLRLFWHGRRVSASCVGRGMLTVGTVLPSYTDPISVPVMTVAARMPPVDAVIKLDSTNLQTGLCGIADWPEFHNGCAAALRMAAPMQTYQLDKSTLNAWRTSAGSASSSAPTNAGDDEDLMVKLMRSWVRSHRYTGVPPDLGAVAAASSAVNNGLGINAVASAAGIPSAGVASGIVPPNSAHGGLFMGLGMLGCLRNISSGDIFEFLQRSHTGTTVGVLLGLAAGKRGSIDPQISKALCLHLPAILPGQFHSLDLPGVVQCNALVGIGLLYEGTGHRAMAEFLVREIPREPLLGSPEPGHDRSRDAYSVCAGYALGLVNLGLGHGEQDAEFAPLVSPSGVAGGSDGAPPAGEAGAASASSALAPVPRVASSSAPQVTNLLSDLGIESQLLKYLLGGKDPEAHLRPKPDDSYPSLTHESDRVNTVVASPAAAIALGLIYLRSGNTRIGAALSAPSTSVGLDAVRPDVLITRGMARTLVMWNEHDADDADRVFDYRAWLVDHGHLPMHDPAAPAPVAAAQLPQVSAPGPVEARVRWEGGRRARICKWMTAQVPGFVRRVMRRILASASSASGPGAGALRLAQLMAMVDDDEEDGTDSKASPGKGAAAPAKPPKAPATVPAASLNTAAIDARDGPLEQIDTEYCKLAYLDCIAGACLGLGLRYGGTGDAVIRDEILQHIQYTLSIRNAAAIMSNDQHKEYKHENGVESDRSVGQVNATMSRADAATVAAARALFEELTRVRHLDANSALELVNTVIFNPAEVHSSASDLLTPFNEPTACFPFRLSPDKLTITPANQPKLRCIGSTPALAAACAPLDRAGIEMALASMVSGLGILMAGTGDVDSLRVIREVRRRNDGCVWYGHLMASGMAMGLLGLAGGKATLSRSNQSIAALVGAFFPFWHHGSASNSYYPQAPRQLWALAVDHRCVDAVQLLQHTLPSDHSAAAREPQQMLPVHAPVEVVLKPTPGKCPRRLRLITPCLFPELHSIQSVSVLGPQFHGYTLNVAANAGHASVLLQSAVGDGDAASIESMVAAPALAETASAVPATPARFTTAPGTSPGPSASPPSASVDTTPRVEPHKHPAPSPTAHMFITQHPQRGGANGVPGSSRSSRNLSVGSGSAMQVTKRRRKESDDDSGIPHDVSAIPMAHTGVMASTARTPSSTAVFDYGSESLAHARDGSDDADMSMELGGVDLGVKAHISDHTMLLPAAGHGSRRGSAAESTSAGALASVNARHHLQGGSLSPSAIVTPDPASAFAQSHGRRCLRPIVLFVQSQQA